MRLKSVILMMFALGCGLVAMVGANQWMDRVKQPGARDVETQDIYVTTQHIDIGEVFTPEMVQVDSWPKDKVPEGAATTWDEIDGRRPNSPLSEGMPILLTSLIDSKTAGGASELIPEGYRVLPVKVTAETGGGNLVQAGDRVDVLVYLRKSCEIQKTITKTILRNVRVFAVNEKTTRDSDTEGKPIQVQTVSLVVSPSQVETLLLASRLGNISLSMRGPNDSTADMGGGKTVDHLLDTCDDASPKKPKRDEPDRGSKFTDFLKTLASSSKQQTTPAVEQPTGPSWIMHVVEPDGTRQVEFGPGWAAPRDVTFGAASNEDSYVPGDPKGETQEDDEEPGDQDAGEPVAVTDD